MSLRRLQSNFSAGEISDDLEGRTDLPLYQNGAARVRNGRPMAQGGVMRRGGLRFCSVLFPAAFQHVDWIFNAEQTYQMIFSNGRVDIYDGVDGHLVQANLTGPWTGAMIGHLSGYAQGDFAFIAHPDLSPQVIKRTGATTFIRQPYVFNSTVSGDEQEIFLPFHRYIRPDLPIRVSPIALGIPAKDYDSVQGWKPGGQANLSTAGGTGWTGYDFFTANYVGTRLLISGAQWQILTVVDAQHATAVLRSRIYRLKLTENAMDSFDGSATVRVYDPYHDFIAGTHHPVIANAIPFGGFTYLELNGYTTVDAVDASNWTFLTGSTSTIARQSGGGPSITYWCDFTQTVDWKEQMYSTERGWPHCVGGYQGRLIFGGGRSSPNRLNFSALEAPFNFDVGTGLDDESIQVGVSGKRTPTIISVVGTNHVQVFSSEGEHYIPRTDDHPALTPTNIAVIPQTTYGSQAGIAAVEFDTSTLFISRNANALRELKWAEIGYTAPSLSFVAQHLVTDPVRLAVQMEDREQGAATALLVNANGTMAALTMLRSEKVAAWALWSTLGDFKTACAVDNRAFFIVQRTLDGVNTYCLEQRDTDHILDCSVMGAYVGRDGQNYLWGGFTHLIGQEIRIVVDGLSDIGPFTPDSLGRVSIPSRATMVEGGLGFVTTVRTLPPELVLADGPTPGEPRRVISAAVRIKNTLGMRVRSTKLINTQAHLDLGLPAKPVTGQVHVYMLGWDDRGQVDITQSSNGPFQLLSANLELEF